MSHSDPDSSRGPSPGSTAACVLCGGAQRTRLFHKQGYDFLRCRHCALVRIDPVPDEPTLAAVYERSYADGGYAKFAEAHDIRLAHARTRVAIVSPHAPDGPWLDVGCSTGAFLEAASERGIDIDGFDVSRAAVDAARGRGFAATHAAVETFEPARPYSYVTAFDVLEHVVDPGGFLERAHDWLAPGGRIALTVPDIRSPQARLMGRHWYYYAPPLHITYFDRATVTRLLEKHRFTPIVIANAPKILTLDYVTGQLATFNPWLHRISAVLSRAVPPRLRARELPIPTGEILVVASA